MCDLTKARVAGLILGVLVAIATGTAGAVTFSANGTPCTGSVILTARGQVSCGTTTISSCAGQKITVIDAQGKINCVTGAPTAPTNVTATADDTKATVTFKTPASDGDAPITGYTVTSIPSGGTDSNAGSTALSHVITGLINGTAYTFTVTATNSAGTSAASTASNSVTPSASKQDQTISFGAAPTISVGGTGTVSATATSGLAVSFSSTTTNTCSVSGSIVTGITAGTCTIAANQAGNASYNAAAQVTQSITVTTAPGTATPTCTLAQSFQTVTPGKIRLVASCVPDATSWNWSANTGFATVHDEPTVLVPTPTISTTYSVTGSNAVGAGNTATFTYTVTASCTLTANPPSIFPGDPSTLTASCSPAATGYNWNGACTATNTTNTCIVTPAATTSYTVTGTGTNTATSTPVKVTVVAPSCMLTANPPSIFPGDPSTLTASCNPAATGYNWNGACPATNTTNTCIVTPAATTSYTVTGTVGNTATSPAATVTVVAPYCTLTAAPSSIGLGDTATLTASCSPAATGYNWNGACPATNTTNTCIVTPAATTSYTVTGTVGNTATSPAATVTVVAPYCTLTAAPSSITLGATSTLTASCSPAATGYNWNGAACQAGTAANICIVTPAAAGTPTYNVTGTTGNTATSNTVTVTVAVPVLDPGCPNGYTYSTVPITWPAHVSITGPLQTMRHCEVKAFQFTMPARAGTGTTSETVYATVPKYLSLSQTPFDFSPALEAAACATRGSNDPIIWNSTTGSPGLCSVVEGATYYLNVRNASSYNGADNCPAGVSCTFYLAW